MPNSDVDRARLVMTAEEIRTLSAEFQLKPVDRAHAYNRGSARFPKAIIATTDGCRFILKRRMGHQENVDCVSRSHAVQIELARNSFPVPQLSKARDGSTWVVKNDCIYEMFAFFEGDRYARLVGEAVDSGAMLSKLHQTLRHWQPAQLSLEHSGYHNSRTVASSWQRLVPKIVGANPSVSSQAIEFAVVALNEQWKLAASVAESALHGAPTQHRSVLHGDFHPGNVIFEIETPAVLLDFDSARIDRTIFDVANGALQFAMQSRTNKVPRDWDANLRIDLIEAFLRGYSKVGPVLLDPADCEAFPALMVEATIAETVPRIAIAGTWRGESGAEVLLFVARMSQWIWSQRVALTKLCLSCIR